MSLNNVKITPEDGWVILADADNGIFSLPMGGQWCIATSTPTFEFIGHRYRGKPVPFSLETGEAVYVRVTRDQFGLYDNREFNVIISRNFPTFNGLINTYLEIDEPIVFTGDFEIEVEAVTSTVASQYILGYDSAAPSNNWLGIDSTGFVRVRFANIDYNTTAGDFTFDGKLHKLFLSRVGSNLIVKLDGFEILNTTCNTNNIYFYKIGERGTGVNFFNGNIINAKFTDLSGAEPVTQTWAIDSDLSSATEANAEGTNFLTYNNFAESPIYVLSNDKTQWDAVDPLTVPQIIEIA